MCHCRIFVLDQPSGRRHVLLFVSTWNVNVKKVINRRDSLFGQILFSCDFAMDHLFHELIELLLDLHGLLVDIWRPNFLWQFVALGDFWDCWGQSLLSLLLEQAGDGFGVHFRCRLSWFGVEKVHLAGLHFSYTGSARFGSYHIDLLIDVEGSSERLSRGVNCRFPIESIRDSFLCLGLFLLDSSWLS